VTRPQQLSLFPEPDYRSAFKRVELARADIDDVIAFLSDLYFAVDNQTARVTAVYNSRVSSLDDLHCKLCGVLIAWQVKAGYPGKYGPGHRENYSAND
jgi:hypothetical protein